jgi:hypothetical protein
MRKPNSKQLQPLIRYGKPEANSPSAKECIQYFFGRMTREGRSMMNKIIFTQFTAYITLTTSIKEEDMKNAIAMSVAMQLFSDQSLQARPEVAVKIAQEMLIAEVEEYQRSKKKREQIAEISEALQRGAKTKILKS